MLKTREFYSFFISQTTACGLGLGLAVSLIFTVLVFIGMALSVSIGNEFVILLIAITFHRKFAT